jgi:hypothetical protein
MAFRVTGAFMGLVPLPVVGNNLSLQIHSFSEDRGKGNKTSNPSICNFSTMLASHILIIADNSYLPSDEAYR